MALFAMYLLEKRGLRGDIVRSVTTSGMLDALGERFGVTVHEMPVGFKYIGTKMMETDAILGGEESGGYAFRGHIPERDGILSGLMMASMIVDYGHAALGDPRASRGPRRPARVRPPRHPLSARRVRGAQGADLRAHAAERARQRSRGARSCARATDDGFKFYLDDGSWVLMRMSGTEPLMRVYAEATTRERVERAHRRAREPERCVRPRRGRASE